MTLKPNILQFFYTAAKLNIQLIKKTINSGKIKLTFDPEPCVACDVAPLVGPGTLEHTGVLTTHVTGKNTKIHLFLVINLAILLAMILYNV